jgi:DNA gyrase/topoisomerase IV subunit A
LIGQDKIDEWIKEIEERPSSAELIIRYIANRLSDLTQREEELAAQNIELLSGRKVEEYENRIASLEFQLELLKRQLGGEIDLPNGAPPREVIPETIDLLVYNPMGQVLRTEFDLASLTSAQVIGNITGERALGDMQPSILATSPLEELLFIFDSGRTITHPVSQLPLSNINHLDWQDAYLEEPRVKEELAAVQPIAKLPIFESCIQVSRRGYLKKMKTAFFTSHIGENYIGTGVKLPADKTCGITFAGKNDLFVMVSQEGYIFSMPIDGLPPTIEEVIRLGITDHIMAFFVVHQQPDILFITQNGKIVHRDAGWLEPANSFKSKGQPLLTKERLAAGVRVIGATPAADADWGVFLHRDGAITVHPFNELLSSGALTSTQTPVSLLSMTAFQMPETAQHQAHPST